MKWYETKLDETIKILIGCVGSGVQLTLIFYAIFYTWRGHEVRTDFIGVIIFSLLALVMLVPTWWRFVLDWYKKEGF